MRRTVAAERNEIQGVFGKPWSPIGKQSARGSRIWKWGKFCRENGKFCSSVGPSRDSVFKDVFSKINSGGPGSTLIVVSRGVRRCGGQRGGTNVTSPALIRRRNSEKTMDPRDGQVN